MTLGDVLLCLGHVLYDPPKWAPSARIYQNS